MRQCVLLWLLLSNVTLAGTWRVPLNYPTIQMAIDASARGDIVLVAPGVYTGDGNRDIDFKGKAITVRSEAGPRTCIINCQGSPQENHRGFYFHSNEGVDSVLEGFMVTGGYRDDYHAAAIECSFSGPRIVNCIIGANTGSVNGLYSGLMIGLWNSDAVISNCLICGNRGNAIDCGGHGYTEEYPRLSNCTIVGNQGLAVYSNGGGRKEKICLTNCIVANNRPRHFSIGTQVYIGGCTMQPGCIEIGIRNCCIEDDPNAIFVEYWSNPLQPPVGSVVVRANPQFAKLGYWDPNGTPANPYDDFWVDGDYHLKSQAGRYDPASKSWVKDDVTSPCIDAGDPNSPIGDEPFPNGGRINMGAYGGTAEASKSYFGEPICETIIAGDINGDCRVDFKDLTLMAMNWLGGASHGSGEGPGDRNGPSPGKGR